MKTKRHAQQRKSSDGPATKSSRKSGPFSPARTVSRASKTVPRGRLPLASGMKLSKVAYEPKSDDDDVEEEDQDVKEDAGNLDMFNVGPPDEHHERRRDKLKARQQKEMSALMKRHKKETKELEEELKEELKVDKSSLVGDISCFSCDATITLKEPPSEWGDKSTCAYCGVGKCSDCEWSAQCPHGCGFCEDCYEHEEPCEHCGGCSNCRSGDGCCKWNRMYGGDSDDTWS